jgi:hypothetical protein
MGYDLVKCLHSLSIAQPLHGGESLPGRQLGVLDG